MTNKDISKIVLEEIRSQGIVPVAKPLEDLRKGALWVFLIGAVLVGALSFSVILFFLISDTWDIYRSLGTWFILRMLPYFWFLMLGVVLVLGKYVYRKTALGHRSRLSMVIGTYILVSLSLGTLAYFFGVGGSIEYQLETRVPAYQHLVSTKASVWNQPEQGLLAGVVVSATDTELTLESFSGVRWTVDIHTAREKGGVALVSGTSIKLIGVQSNATHFTATEIRPWEGRGSGGAQMGGGKMR